jgi:hypothetical protein
VAGHRHRLRSEVAVVLGLYGVYELARGLVVSDAREADHHAHGVVALERWLHVFQEANVQHAARNLPGLTSLFGTAYLTLHLASPPECSSGSTIGAPPPSRLSAPHS